MEKQIRTLKIYKNIKQINEHFTIVTAFLKICKAMNILLSLLRFLKIFKSQRSVSVKMSVRKMFETESNKQRMTR